jgi:hypothetical protein
MLPPALGLLKAGRRGNKREAADADTAYQGGGPAVRTPQRRRRRDPDTGRYRRLSSSQKQVNTAHARQRGPGERVTPS